MLISREFEITKQIANSDGKPVAELGSETYVALYDDKIISDKALRAYVDGFDECSSEENENIVVLSAANWKKLRKMIMDSYRLEKK